MDEHVAGIPSSAPLQLGRDNKLQSKDRDEALRWLKLGYETYGLEGAAAIAQAMGMPVVFRNASTRRGPWASSNQRLWTARAGSDSLQSDLGSVEPDPSRETLDEDWAKMAAGLSCDDARLACKRAGRPSLTTCMDAWIRCKQG